MKCGERVFGRIPFRRLRRQDPASNPHGVEGSVKGNCRDCEARTRENPRAVGSHWVPLRFPPMLRLSRRNDQPIAEMRSETLPIESIAGFKEPSAHEGNASNKPRCLSQQLSGSTLADSIPTVQPIRLARHSGLSPGGKGGRGLGSRARLLPSRSDPRTCSLGAAPFLRTLSHAADRSHTLFRLASRRVAPPA